MKDKIIAFCKKEIVLVIAVLAAVLSMFFVHPSKEYFAYPDYRVLALLFCLMIIVAGLQEIGVFMRIGKELTERVKSSRGLTMVLVMICFFTSMLITNDVALITFVPFAIELLKMAGLKDKIIKVVVLQTIAANLGSMFTPIGNPQNLYLYNLTGMSIGRLLLLMLPLSAVSCLLLFGLIWLEKPVLLTADLPETNGMIDVKHTVIYGVLFFACLLTVVRILPFPIMLGIVVVGILAVNRGLFAKVDYCLLGTFLGFFVFVGNMENIPAVKQLLESLLSGRELLVSVLASQVISNVPAAMLLAGFTTQYEALLYGVNIGGLGTLIASLASVISYKAYGAEANAQKGKYMLVFTVYNLLFLAVLLILGFLFLPLLVIPS